MRETDARKPQSLPWHLFRPYRGFDSPEDAADYCRCFDNPRLCLIRIVAANLEMDEIGFAQELLQLWDAVAESGQTLVSPFDYAYADIDEYENITGLKVNDGFRVGWHMARTTNADLGIGSETEE